MSSNEFVENLNLGSVIPLILFFSGIYTIYFFSTNNFSYGCILMMINFVLYITNNLLTKSYNLGNLFNQYLEDMSNYLAFSVTTIVFGFIYFSSSAVMILIIGLYSISQLLNLARNWVLTVKNSKGWPVPLNGIFFPFCFYIITVGVVGFDQAIFMVFYMAVTFLSISEKNFLAS